MNQARKLIVLELAQTPPERWSAFYLPELQGQVDAAMQQFAREFQITLAQWQELGFDAGALSVDKELRGFNLAKAAPQISQDVLNVSKGFSADKIRRLTVEATSAINGEITLGILAQQPVTEVVSRIGTSLVDPTSAFKTIGARAEAIYRTETNRIFHMSRQTRAKTAEEALPGLEKEWVYSHFPGPFGRTGHMDAHRQRVPVDKPFMVAPRSGASKEPMMHPHDPGASAANTINCRCTYKLVAPRGAARTTKPRGVTTDAENDYQRQVIQRMRRTL